jgi:hypothetical protein
MIYYKESSINIRNKTRDCLKSRINCFTQSAPRMRQGRKESKYRKLSSRSLRKTLRPLRESNALYVEHFDLFEFLKLVFTFRR